MATGRRLAAALVAAVLLAAGAAGAADPVSVPVRASAHDRFGRMVFDWPTQVGFTASVADGQLVVAFDQPIAARFDSVGKALASYVGPAKVSADARTITFELKRPATLRSFRNKTSVVLDLTAEEGKAATPPDEATPPKAATPPEKAGRPEKEAPRPPAKPAGDAVIQVRAGRHQGYSRLVFEGPRVVGYAVARDGETVVVTFDQPGSANLSSIDHHKPENVRAVSQGTVDGKLAVTLAIPANAGMRHFRNGNTIVVDVLNPTGADESREPVPASPPPPQAPAVPDPATPPAPTPAAPDPAAAVVPGKPAPAGPSVPTPAIKPTPPGGKPPAPSIAPSTTPVSATPPAPVVPPAPADPPAPAPPPVPVVPAAAPAAAGAADQPQPPVVMAEMPTVLAVNTGVPSAAAVFARSGYLYVVFDKAAEAAAATLTGPAQTLVGPVEPVQTSDGRAFRIGFPPWLRTKVERDGTTWRVVLGRTAVMPPAALVVEPQPEFVVGPRLVVYAEEAQAVVRVTDPEIGDPLLVVPLPVPGMAVVERQHYAQLELLPAFQGIVIRPIVEEVNVRPVREGVELTTAGGLRLSPANDVKVAAPTPAGGAPRGPHRLFDLAGWHNGPPESFTGWRQKLQQAVIDVPDTDRSHARMALARFYFANGYGPEALGQMQLMVGDQPDLEGWPEFRALRGAARTVANDPDGALADLSNPVLDDSAEVALWRASALALRRDWPAAAKAFTSAAPLLDKLPEPFFRRLMLQAIEARLQSGDRADAVRLLDRLVARQTPGESPSAVQFFRGEAWRQAGNSDRAADLWRQVAESNDRLYRSRAEYALINLELATGKVSPTVAADRLEGLRFSWRGDDQELDTLQRLGEVYIQAGDYPNGFRIMRETAGIFPDSPRTAKTAEKMTQIFGELYKDGASKMAPVVALTLYDQFRELTPVGPPGDEIIRQLAERLVQIDLLDRAANLLEHQVNYRLVGVDKARIGARLAAIRLLDGKPQQALDGIVKSAGAPDIPNELVAERRLLQARALADLTRGDEALTLLAGDESRPANLLRVDIAWRSQRWAQAATALAKVIPPPPPEVPKAPDAATAPLILNRAVALALAADGPGLAELRASWGPSMATGPDATTFSVLTRPEQATDRMDIASIRQRVAEVDLFQSFLVGYRGKRQTPTPASGN